jgi:hypothetical protein
LADRAAILLISALEAGISQSADRRPALACLLALAALVPL